MSDNSQLHAWLSRIQKPAFLVGFAGLGLCVIGAFLNPTRFFQAYLIAYLLWLGTTLGCFAILMIHHVAGGRWGFAVRRLLESAVATLPLLAVLWVPLLFGLPTLYPWARPEVVAGDLVLQHKQPFLNVPFFISRGIVYFAIWLITALLLERASKMQDRAPSRSVTKRLTMISGLGLGLYVLTMTLASVDWAMSLEPHWFSSMYGILTMTGQVLGAFAGIIVMAAILSRFQPYTAVLEPSIFHDLGKFLLTFVIFWAYIAYSQFLIIWSGNLPEENVWYLKRLAGGWKEIGIALVALHFFLPFLLLLSRQMKRDPARLSKVALLIFVMGGVDLFWVVAPGFGRVGAIVHWMDVVAPIGVGGVWLGMFIRQLKSRSALPAHDSRVEEELEWA